MTDMEIDAGYDYEYESGKEDGWEDARKYYKQLFLDFWKEFKDIKREDIEELFERPEDESEILRRAALSRGQP